MIAGALTRREITSATQRCRRTTRSTHRQWRSTGHQGGCVGGWTSRAVFRALASMIETSSTCENTAMLICLPHARRLLAARFKKTRQGQLQLAAAVQGGDCRVRVSTTALLACLRCAAAWKLIAGNGSGGRQAPKGPKNHSCCSIFRLISERKTIWPRPSRVVEELTVNSVDPPSGRSR